MIDNPRRPIHAGDPPEVFELEAKLLAQYSEDIGRDVDGIIAKYPDDATIHARAYINKIGENIPDETIRAAVKKLATNKFRQCGIG